MNLSPLPRRVMVLCRGFSQTASPVRNPTSWQGGCLKSLHMLRLSPKGSSQNQQSRSSHLNKLCLALEAIPNSATVLPPPPSPTPNETGKSPYFYSILSRICPSCLFCVPALRLNSGHLRQWQRCTYAHTSPREVLHWVRPLHSVLT